MTSVTGHLRAFATQLRDEGRLSNEDLLNLLLLANQIDEAHRTRMDQAKRDMRRAACRYMASVVEDYKHGRKRVRKERVR